MFKEASFTFQQNFGPFFLLIIQPEICWKTLIILIVAENEWKCWEKMPDGESFSETSETYKLILIHCGMNN